MLARNRQVRNQAAIDLYQVNRQRMKWFMEARPAPKLSRASAYFQISHGLENRQRALRILIDRSLGHFKAQLSWGDFPFCQQFAELAHQIEDP